MLQNAQAIVLSRSQEACLSALRLGKSSLTHIAMKAALSIKKTNIALSDLESLGLAERSRSPKTKWRATPRGKTSPFVLDGREEPQEDGREPSPSGRRLLELLDRPIEGRTVAKTLGLTRQGALHVLRRLHLQGHVKFADPENLSWWVLRGDDDTPLLTWEQELVLSALPGAYATDAVQIKRRTTLSKDKVEAALQHLVSVGLAEAVGEFNGAALFRATSEGLNHRQNRPDIAVSERPHMPVYSSRVQEMLTAINDGGALRVKDVKAALGWTFQATNALIQYLKRRGLIEKSEDAFEAPYVLTAMGCLTLAEMTSPGQMTRGYAPGSNSAGRQATTRAVKYAQPARRARAEKSLAVKQPRLPVNSERVRAVLTMISSAGALRIKDISDNFRLPRQTINSLMQYLKRRGFVQKTAEGLGSPFQLTASGRTVLAEMERRRVA